MDKKLYKAIEEGNLEQVKLMISQGADIKKPYLENYNYLAIFSGNIELLEYIESLGVPLFSKKNNWDKDDVIHENLLKSAMESKNINMIKYLIEKRDVSIDCIKKNNDIENILSYKYNAYDTVLGKAVKSDIFTGKKANLDILKYLFEELKLLPNNKAIEYLMKEAEFETPEINAYLQHFIIQNENDKKLLVKIYEKGFKSLDNTELFLLYTKRIPKKGEYSDYHVIILSELNERNISSLQIKEYCQNKNIIPYILCYYSSYYFKNNFDKLRYMVEDLKVNINVYTNEGEVPVKYAYHSGGNNSIYQYLITKGANLNLEKSDDSKISKERILELDNLILNLINK